MTEAATLPAALPAQDAVPGARRYALAAWGFLVFTVFVILWGAVVRATLSGDGCGDHWPLCDGEVVPVAPSVERMIEFTHRVTSGLAWLGAFAFFVVSRRVFPRGHLARRGGFLVFLLMTIEALLGAGLVIFRMVADNPDAARGWWAAGHLVNTFVLIGVLTMNAWWAGGGSRLDFAGKPGLRLAFVGAFVGLMFIGMSGAIAALGDTLFPVTSVSEGFAQDLDGDAHIFLRLRGLHPLIGLIVGALVLGLAGNKIADGTSRQKKVAIALLVAFVVQVSLGFLNIALLAPIWLQLVHLALGDTVMVLLVLLAAETFRATTNRRGASSVRAG